MTVAVTNGSECYVPFSCQDASGNAFTPTSVSYEVWDTTNNVEVVQSTSVTPAQSGTITLSASVNTMNAASAKIEQRTITVKFGIPGGSFQNLSVAYALLRRAGTP